jgi:hypothetical protein
LKNVERFEIAPNVRVPFNTMLTLPLAFLAKSIEAAFQNEELEVTQLAGQASYDKSVRPFLEQNVNSLSKKPIYFSNYLNKYPKKLMEIKLNSNH